jgi:hypothetical protein
MRKFVSIGGRQVSVVITVAILATLAALYYFVYIPNKESDLYQEHFGWLQRSDNNIRDKISATDSLLSHLLQTVGKTDSKGTAQKTGLEGKISYIRKHLLDSQQSIDVTKAKGSTKTDHGMPHFFIEADSSLGRFIISASMKQDADSIVASMWYKFDEFFKPVLELGSFEHHVVFFKGRYIYEDFRSGLGYKLKNEDSLLRLGQWMTGAGVIDQQVGGVAYKMFLQPINLFGRDRLIVAGLHSKKKFDAERKQLPPDKMMLAIIIALGILLFFPWIRIYFLGKYDRLTLGDAVESLLVAKFLMAVLFLFFVKYSFISRSPDAAPRKVLSGKISGAFHNEIESAYKYLGRFDSAMSHERLTGNIINLGKNDIKKSTSNSSFNPMYGALGATEGKGLNDLYKQFGVIELNWMDSTGNILYNWTTGEHNSAPGNYGNRDYFKDISKGRVIRPDTSMAFTLEPVISWTNGEFMTVICRRSNVKVPSSKGSSPSFVLMDWSMKSMDDVVMPAGFSFAIIDGEGEVKYHSDKRKNLNENLRAEFSNKKELQEVLNGGYPEVFNTGYYEQRYSVSAEPIKGYPYFIVIMSSSEFPNGVDVETFAFSWGMMLIFLIVVLIDLFIFVMSSGRRSMFRKQSLVTSWLWPRESSQNEYIVAGVGHVIVIIALALVFSLHLFSYLSGIFVLLLCVPLLTIFLNTLFIHKYKVKGSKWYERYKDRCSWYCLAFFIIVNVIALWLLRRNYREVLSFELALIAIGALLFFFYTLIGQNDNSKNENEKNKYSYLHWFTFMALTRLIVTSAIPIVFFYIASYNFEQNLLARNRQYNYAAQLQNKFPVPDSLQSLIKAVQPKNTNYDHAVYTDSEWINSLAIADTLPRTHVLSREDTTTAELFNYFGSYFEYISGLDNDNFYLASPPDDAYRFNNFFDTVLYKGGCNKLYVPLKGENYMQLNATNLNYIFPSPLDADGGLFWLKVLIALVIFYIMLYDIVKRVCSIDTMQVSTWEVAGDHCRKLINSDLSFWMVYASPDIKDFLSKKIGAPQKPGQNFVGPPRIIDFDNMQLPSEPAGDDMITKILSKDNPNVCLLHIENRLKDEKVNSAKLDCIRSLLKEGKRIIIVSPLHPIYFREMLRSKTTESIAESFDHLIGNLPVIIKPLVKNGNPPTEEYSYTDFLWNLHNKLSFASEKATQKAKKELAYDELVLQEQSVFHNFYTEIWESLSTDEKFILYDLAEDGLVNIRNRFAVNLLVNKGLIHNDNGHLHLFNRSFRHFIVSATSKESMKNVKMLRKRRSNWTNLKKPMLIIVVATFIFFGISQESMYKNFVGILGGITAGIPILLKVLSMFDIQNDRLAKNGEEKPGGEVA